MDGVTTITEINEDSHDDVDLIAEFVKDCRLRGYSSETIRSHMSNLRTVSRFLNRNGLSFHDADKDSLRLLLDYLKDTRKVGHKTLDCYFSALSSFYEYLAYEGKAKSNPIPSFRKRYLNTYKNHQPTPPRKLISVEEMALLINSTLEIRDRTLMTVLAKTGVRRSELISMDVEDVDFERGMIRLKRKNKRSNL